MKEQNRMGGAKRVEWGVCRLGGRDFPEKSRRNNGGGKTPEKEKNKRRYRWCSGEVQKWEGGPKGERKVG